MYLRELSVRVGASLAESASMTDVIGREESPTMGLYLWLRASTPNEWSPIFQAAKAAALEWLSSKLDGEFAELQSSLESVAARRAGS